MARKKSSPVSEIPDLIYANVSPRSIGGVSLFDAGNQINSQTFANFYSEDQVIRGAVGQLQNAGFNVLQVTQSTINICGSKKTYDDAFNTSIIVEQREVIKPTGKDVAEFLDVANTELPGLISTQGTSFENLIEGIALEEPRYYMAESMFAPKKAYWHLDVPAGVSLGTNADRAHRSGITGKGVKVAMVDSGWYKHRFFVNRGYRASSVVLAPGAANSLQDESGHGTGESANIFAVAPDVELLPVKMSFVNTKAAFDQAVGLNPDIITCSWGSDKKFGPLSAADNALAASISAAVASGIVVIFSAGNGHWGLPGQHPDVISAGGVFMNVDESLRASDYASGFISNIYPNRRVPDLSGLVGMQPGASYIMLPLEPGDDIDNSKSGGTHPPGDETANDDGWAAFSGTSAAAPQLAGAAALVKQACSKLTPHQIRDVLMKSARDVTTGSTHPNTGSTASSGPDSATGNGLVDAHRAVMVAKIRCLSPVIGPQPIQPITPQPIQPITPQPIQPITPQPIQPITPQPIQPIITPAGQLDERTQQGQETVTQSGQPTSYLSTEDAQTLEDMIVNSDLDLDDIAE